MVGYVIIIFTQPVGPVWKLLKSYKTYADYYFFHCCGSNKGGSDVEEGFEKLRLMGRFDLRPARPHVLPKAGLLSIKPSKC